MNTTVTLLAEAQGETFKFQAWAGFGSVCVSAQDKEGDQLGHEPEIIWSYDVDNVRPDELQNARKASARLVYAMALADDSCSYGDLGGLYEEASALAFGSLEDYIVRGNPTLV